MAKPLTLRIEDVAGQTITAKTPDGQTWRLPADCVEGTPKAEGQLTLVAVAPGAQAETGALARAILNELLGQPPA